MDMKQAAWRHRADLEDMETRQWIQRCDLNDQDNIRQMNRSRWHLNYTAIFLAALLVSWAVASWLGIR